MGVHSDSKIVGPGVWYLIHSMALKASNGTYNDKSEFIKFMHHLSKTFPCPVCKEHINEYLARHSFESYCKDIVDKESKIKIGLFKWSWEFHNAVNIRLQKKTMDFRTALHLYLPDDENTVCTTNCGK
jgi:hypothetical protein